MAVSAGNDLILLSNGDPAYEGKAMSAIKAAIKSGRLDRAKLHDSAVRVNQLRDTWGLPLTPCAPSPTA
jgi:hypothetical protein